ncbi:uncharacterized protein At4g22758 isoform X2 [Phalaenopsis equestris]|uniref:uncharacterized protein At4g22758 isoform X2 n=1 Tax=Phalaenopsis equestris TaxID=78828 RepID=UPI0009E1F928|nr:uncharacterized protein At4g22758 isoform X2 [Phalaenopsis equestris]
MPEKTLKLHRAPSNLSSDARRPPHPLTSSPRRPILLPLRRPKRSKPYGILPRSASEPILWRVPAIGGEREKGKWTASIRIPRPHTCTDVMSASRWLKSPSAAVGDSREETKVVVSVAVEGSPGPVKAMVKLGASVEEAIAAVVDEYSREGRSPQLDLQAVASFELHHSHFSLHSLNKSDKIGEIGGRSFYLRTRSSSHSFNSGREERSHGFCAEIHQVAETHNSSATSSHPFFNTIATIFLMIERRTKKICKMVSCFLCV